MFISKWIFNPFLSGHPLSYMSHPGVLQLVTGLKNTAQCRYWLYCMQHQCTCIVEVTSFPFHVSTLLCTNIVPLTQRKFFRISINQSINIQYLVIHIQLKDTCNRRRTYTSSCQPLSFNEVTSVQCLCRKKKTIYVPGWCQLSLDKYMYLDWKWYLRQTWFFKEVLLQISGGKKSQICTIWNYSVPVSWDLFRTVDWYNGLAYSMNWFWFTTERGIYIWRPHMCADVVSLIFTAQPVVLYGHYIWPKKQSNRCLFPMNWSMRFQLTISKSIWAFTPLIAGFKCVFPPFIRKGGGGIFYC